MSTGQGYDNTDKTIAAVILTGAIILLPGGYFTYNLYQKLGDAQAEIETTKADSEKVSGQLQEKESEIKDVQANLVAREAELIDMKDKLAARTAELEAIRKDLERTKAAFQRLAQDRETLATCLTGVVAALASLDEGSEADALIMLGRVESSCEASGSIIESISSSSSSDIPLTSS